jgi:hypothetical protein
VRSLTSVRPNYLQAAFDQIDGQYGGMGNYLVDEPGLDEEALGYSAGEVSGVGAVVLTEESRCAIFG